MCLFFLNLLYDSSPPHTRRSRAVDPFPTQCCEPRERVGCLAVMESCARAEVSQLSGDWDRAVRSCPDPTAPCCSWISSAELLVLRFLAQN